MKSAGFPRKRGGNSYPNLTSHQPDIDKFIYMLKIPMKHIINY